MYRKDRFVLTRSEAGPFLEKGKPCSQVYNICRLQPLDESGNFAKLPEINVVGLHLASKKTQAGEELRKLQIEQVMGIIKDRFSDKETIIMGDFNGSWTDNKGVKPLAYPAAIASGYKSMYQEVRGKEPEWTSWKTRNVGELKYTIDFIMHNSSGSIQPKGVLDVMPDSVVGPTGFPSWDYPSDHVAMVADFVMRSDNEE